MAENTETSSAGESSANESAAGESAADRFRRLAATFTGTVESVPAERWGDPSPCTGWVARDVVRHVLDSHTSFLGRAGLSIPPGPSVDDEPAAAWAHGRDAVQAILDDPERAGTEYEGYGGRSTVAQTFGSFMCIDLVVHRWDLAHATGVNETIPAGDMAFVRAFAERMGETLRTSGAFGPELPAPEGADEQGRLLAFLGRSVD